jgi:tetratricopeptide (TPR) repeat protein
MIDTVAVVVIAAGTTYLLIGPGGTGTVDFPVIQQNIEPDGRRSVTVNNAALQDAFARAGLPDPPDLNGADPVPVDRLMGLAREWVESDNTAALGRLGQVYQALEEHEAALGCFAAATDLDPIEVRWRYALGIECQALGLDVQAMAVLTEVSRIDPVYATTWARLGALALEAGDLDAAAAYYEQYCRREPGFSPGHVGLGRVALARGETDLAVEHFSAAVGRSPDDYLAHRFLGRAYAAGGSDELARREQATAERLPQYSGWLSFDPRLQESHELANTQRYLTNQMRLAAGAADYERFALIAEALRQRRPGDHGNLRNLATVYRELGRLDEAREAIDASLTLKPDSSASQCVRAQIAFAAKDYEAVHWSLNLATRIDPADPAVFELRGRTHFVQGRHADGIAAVRRSIELDPDSIATRMLLAIMLQESGRPQEAAVVADDVVRRDPGNARARALLSSIRKATGGS